MFMADSPEFVVVYLAAMRMGAVPVPVSTMLRADGLAELLRDSRARLLAVSRGVRRPRRSRPRQRHRELAGVLADGAGCRVAAPAGAPRSTTLAAEPARRRRSTRPTRRLAGVLALHLGHHRHSRRRAMHRHGSIQVVCETYGAQVLGIRPDDRCLSAAKAFFAYGLGNSVLFPLSVGAAARAGAGAVPAGPDRRAGREVRRDAVLRRADVLRQHAPRRAAGRRAGRGAAGRVGRRGAARRALPAVDRRTSASTSSTASA